MELSTRSPDRPGTPSSFEYHILLQGGHSSATDLSPRELQRAKDERLTDRDEYRRALSNKSSLQAENTWLREIHSSATALQEDTIKAATGLLCRGAGEIQNALVQFYILFGTADSDQRSSSLTTPDFDAIAQGLKPVFETYREGLDRIRNARWMLEDGGRIFASRIQESNANYERFYGIDDR